MYCASLFSPRLNKKKKINILDFSPLPFKEKFFRFSQSYKKKKNFFFESSPSPPF
jgi:hypothetical protein